MGIFLRESRAPEPVNAAPAVTLGRARSAAFNAPRGITASAERIQVSNLTVLNRPYAEWQREAWIGYERVGEIHFGFNLLASLLSRVRIYPASIGEANEAPVDVRQTIGRKRVSRKIADAAEAAMDDLQRAEFASLVRAFSLNISVPGECYLVGPCDATRNMWSIKSVDEIQVRPGGAILVPTRTGNQNQAPLPKDLYIARIWRQHPRWSTEPDSSMVGVADSVQELLMLQHLVRSATRSRLNAGLLFVPDGIASAQSKVSNEPVLEEPADPMEALAQQSTVDPSGPFMTQLMESMMTPISDEGSASAVVPMLATGPGELGAMIRHVTFARESDQWLVDRIDSIMNRILQGIDMPKEIVTGLQHVRYCMDSNTQALTRNGWKNYSDLAVGEPILTLNPETHLNEWQPIQAVNTFDCVDEPMLSMEQRGHSSLSTMEHRWIVRRATSRKGRRAYDQKVVTSREMSTGHFIPVAAPAAELPIEAKYSDAFVELIAWYWTEGYISRLTPAFDHCTDRVEFRATIDQARRRLGLTWVQLSHMVGTYSSDNSASVSIHHFLRAGAVTSASRERVARALHISPDVLHAFFVPRTSRQHIVITQSEKVNSPYVQRIRACLTALVGPATPHPRGGGRAAWSEKTTELHNVVQFTLNDELVQAIQAVCPGDDKITDLAFVHSLTRAQLELFIETAIAADGWWRTTGEGVIHQKVAARLDALELACILSGRGVHRYTYATKGGWTQHTLAIKKRTWVQPIRTNSPRVETTYTGAVWCPTVENHTWYARRNGTVFCTANSNAVVIDEGLYKANIEPLALTFVDALTEVYLRPVLKAQGFTEDELDNVVVWYDPSEIVTRPNKEDEATQGTDRLLLSPAAWRREHGYPESDAPNEEDLSTMLLNKMTALPPEVITKLLQKAMPKILGDLEVSIDSGIGPNGPSDPNQASQQDPNVVKFPAQTQNSQPKADPQRTAIQQVGVK